MLWMDDLPTSLFGVMTIATTILLALAGLLVTYGNLLNRISSSRRQRVEAVAVGIPGVLSAVVLIGAMIAIVCSCFFQIQDPRSMRS